MARVLALGPASPVGSVLPLRRVAGEGGRQWQSGRWFFRNDTLFLLPGDSPMGLRLPLDSLPWADPDSIEHDQPPDPFAPRAKLPAQASLRRPPSPYAAPAPGMPPAPH